MDTGYYNSRKDKLLRDLRLTAQLARGFVAERYGEEYAERLSRSVEEEYKAIIPRMPYVEGAMAGALNAFLRVTAQEVAVYKAMKRDGKTLAEAWEVCHEAIRLRMERFPRWKARLLRWVMYSTAMRRRIRRRAAKKERLRLGAFEMRYMIGDGSDFDWGVDYLACGNLELIRELGAEEFAPYICMSDIALGDALGWGVIRTRTLADGCDHCDFRFKKGAETQITSRTAEVQETIDKIRRDSGD